MALAFQGMVLGEEELCELLETQQVGTEVLNVLLLNQRLPGCYAEVTSASLDDLMQWLQQSIPPNLTTFPFTTSLYSNSNLSFFLACLIEP